MRALVWNGAQRLDYEDAPDPTAAVGIARYGALELPTVLVQGEHSPTPLRERLADLAASLQTSSGS